MIRIIDDWYDSYPEYDDWDMFPNARQVPTVDEFDEFLAANFNDIVKQVVSGQGISFGYECPRFSENEIPSIPTDLLEKLERQQEQRLRYNKVNKHKIKAYQKVYRTKAKAIKLDTLLDELLGFEQSEQLRKRLRHYASIKHNQKTL